MSTINIFKNSTDFETYAAGDIIFNAGDPAGPMYAVKEGEVEILLGDDVVETLSAGGIMGEMSLIDTNPRSATARAKTDCQLVPVTQERFQFLVQQTPYFAITVMGIMAERLRRYKNAD